jgi:hypothetical protein
MDLIYNPTARESAVPSHIPVQFILMENVGKE